MCTRYPNGKQGLGCNNRPHDIGNLLLYIRERSIANWYNVGLSIEGPRFESYLLPFQSLGNFILLAIPQFTKFNFAMVNLPV